MCIVWIGLTQIHEHSWLSLLFLSWRSEHQDTENCDCHYLGINTVGLIPISTVKYQDLSPKNTKWTGYSCHSSWCASQQLNWKISLTWEKAQKGEDRAMIIGVKCNQYIFRTDVGGHRKPKLFFVSSTSTTTTIKTTTNCYYSDAGAPDACRRKKRSFLSDHVMDHVDFQPSQVESGMDDSVSEGRQGKFLLYWLTTTTTSVTTEYTKTVTVWSVGCTPSGGVLCNAG